MDPISLDAQRCAMYAIYIDMSIYSIIKLPENYNASSETTCLNRKVFGSIIGQPEGLLRAQIIPTEDIDISAGALMD